VRDPVLLEIVKNAYTTVGEEMGIVVAHSAYSTMVKESRGQGGGGIFNAKGHLITGPGLLHSSAVRPTLLEVLKDFPADTMRDGDAFLCNHPYRGGIHANDIMLFKPVFFQGKLAFFTSALMHVADIGGLSAGGLPANATEMYHEGLILPPVKFYDRGTPVDAIARIIESNSRTPEKVMGDLRALLAGTNVGAARLIQLAEKYGHDGLRDATDELIDYAERRIRQDLRQLPQGVYRGSFIIDDDGIEQRPQGFKVQVKVEIKDGVFGADFTGTDRQARGPINSPLAESTAGVMFAMRCFVDPTIPMNEGCYRVLKMVFPEGTLVNPRPPAALNSRMATVMAMMDSILRALSTAHPERAVAAAANIQVYTMNGVEEGSRRVWTFMDPSFGGAGARSFRDGADVTGDLIFGGGGTTISTEAFESEYPVLFQRHELWLDSGGPGKWRGGLGLRREIKVLGDTQATARIADRARLRLWRGRLRGSRLRRGCADGLRAVHAAGHQDNHGQHQRSARHHLMVARSLGRLGLHDVGAPGTISGWSIQAAVTAATSSCE